MTKIVFATGNRGKLREASEILGEGFELVTPADFGITEDIPETGETLQENSLQKARYIYDRKGCDCFADDTGWRWMPSAARLESIRHVMRDRPRTST